MRYAFFFLLFFGCGSSEMTDGGSDGALDVVSDTTTADVKSDTDASASDAGLDASLDVDGVAATCPLVKFSPQTLPSDDCAPALGACDPQWPCPGNMFVHGYKCAPMKAFPLGGECRYLPDAAATTQCCTNKACSRYSTGDSQCYGDASTFLYNWACPQGTNPPGNCKGSQWQPINGVVMQCCDTKQ